MWDPDPEHCLPVPYSLHVQMQFCGFVIISFGSGSYLDIFVGTDKNMLSNRHR